MIRVFLTDVDGVLTDSTYYVLPDGQRIKRFNTRDFVGLSRLHKAGCHVGVITGDAGATCVESQIARAAPFARLYEGISDKQKTAREYVDSLGYTLDEVAFIGDDTNDADLLTVVGLAACPLDAVSDVRELVQARPDAVIVPYRGGNGCVRDFAELILAAWYNGVK